MSLAPPALRALVREGALPADDAARLAVVQALLERDVPVTHGPASPAAAGDAITLVLDRFGGAPPADEERTRYADLDGLDAAGLAALVDDVR